MGVVVMKAPEKTVTGRLVKLVKRFVDGFMEFADYGFRYIDIPKK